MRHSCGSCALRSRLRARVRSKSLRGSAVCTSLGRGGGKRGGGFSQSFCVPSSMWRAAVWTGDTPSVEAVKCRL
jgi:hypothetical protein